MAKKFASLFLITVFVVGSLLFLAHPQEVSAQESAGMKSLKIGAIFPLSGPIAFTGIGALRGVEFAVKNINEKGMPGRGPGILVGNQRYKLEIVSYDDSADPAKSVAGMRRLVELHKVPVIVGPFGTAMTWACQEVNTQLGVLFNGMTQSDLSRRKGNTLFIQERVPTIYFGEPMAQACTEKGYKRACVVTDIVESYASHGKRFAQKFESLGGQVLAFQTVDVKHTTDFHSVMTSMKSKNPDVIFVAMVEEPLALATTHALDVGYKGKFIFTSDWGSRAEKIIGLEKVVGALVQVKLTAWWLKYPQEDKKGNYTALLKQFRQTYKEDPAVTFDSTYDPTWMFARAMEIANTVTDARAIRDACPKAIQEGKLPLIFPRTDVLKNGLMVGCPDVLLEITKDGYNFVKELAVSREVLE